MKLIITGILCGIIFWASFNVARMERFTIIPNTMHDQAYPNKRAEDILNRLHVDW